MKVVLLAGGRGSRIAEETSVKPKPMIEIGGRPVLWHIMKIYAHHGLRDFIICLGYKGHAIREYFANFHLYASEVTIDLAARTVDYLQQAIEPWRITLVDTGEQTLTGGRLRRVRHLLDPAEPFCFNYGDGLADVDIAATIAFHRSHRRLATVTAVIPPGRYGALDLEGDRVARFTEKPSGDQGYINGGFFVLNAAVIDLIEGDATSWEQGPLMQLASAGELHAYKHPGFWQAMDTMRDKDHLEALWQSGHAPWKVWP